MNSNRDLWQAALTCLLLVHFAGCESLRGGSRPTPPSYGPSGECSALYQRFDVENADIRRRVDRVCNFFDWSDFYLRSLPKIRRLPLPIPGYSDDHLFTEDELLGVDLQLEVLSSDGGVEALKQARAFLAALQKKETDSESLNLLMGGDSSWTRWADLRAGIHHRTVPSETLYRQPTNTEVSILSNGTKDLWLLKAIEEDHRGKTFEYPRNDMIRALAYRWFANSVDQDVRIPPSLETIIQARFNEHREFLERVLPSELALRVAEVHLEFSSTYGGSKPFWLKTHGKIVAISPKLVRALFMINGGADFPDYLQLYDHVMSRGRHTYRELEDLELLEELPLRNIDQINRALDFPIAHELAHIYRRTPLQNEHRDEPEADCFAVRHLVGLDPEFSLGLFETFTLGAIEQGATSLWEDLESANAQEVQARLQRLTKVTLPVFRSDALESGQADAFCIFGNLPDQISRQYVDGGEKALNSGGGLRF